MRKASFTTMTAQALYDIFKDYCPLSEKMEGIKYKSLDSNTIEIHVPKYGKFVFEYHNDRKWRFEKV